MALIHLRQPQLASLEAGQPIWVQVPGEFDAPEMSVAWRQGPSSIPTERYFYFFVIRES